jgi:hypothetical protein
MNIRSQENELNSYFQEYKQTTEVENQNKDLTQKHQNLLEVLRGGYPELPEELRSCQSQFLVRFRKKLMKQAIMGLSKSTETLDLSHLM